MFVPSDNESNHYLSSLAAELDARGVDVLDYSWHSLLPILGPMWAADRRPDVVHVHWFNALVIGTTWTRTLVKGIRLFFELLFLRLVGVSAVWTVHNLSAHDTEHPRWELFWRSVAARWLFDHLIVHCKRADRLVRETYRLGTSTNVSIIPHGHYLDTYDCNHSKSEARADLGIDADDRVFAFFGRIRQYKQVPALIEAFERLNAERSTLLIAGNPDTDTLRRRIAERSEGRDDIRVQLEFIPDDDVPKHIAAADIVALPYRDILTSGSAILAMSFARPVIAPRMGCLPDLIEDGVDGMLYNPDNPHGLEAAMEQALAADLDEMGQRGYGTVEHLDWGGIASRTRGVYES